MTDERYKEIMEGLGMPMSNSLLLALQQIVNETEQELFKKHEERNNELKSLVTKIRDKATTLIAVQDLEKHDKNFLCNAKVCNSQQREYLAEIWRLCSHIPRI